MTNEQPGGDDLDHAVIRNLRELIAEHDLTHEELAIAMQQQGFSQWTRNRVAQTVTLRRSLSLAEIVGICLVFEVPMERLLRGDEMVTISPGAAIPLPDVRAAISHGTGIRTGPEVDADIRWSLRRVHNRLYAARLRVSEDDIAKASQGLYGFPWVALEIDGRLGDVQGMSRASMNARTGHIVRSILAELRQYLGLPAEPPSPKRTAAQMLETARKADARRNRTAAQIIADAKRERGE